MDKNLLWLRKVMKINFCYRKRTIWFVEKKIIERLKTFKLNS